MGMAISRDIRKLMQITNDFSVYTSMSIARQKKYHDKVLLYETYAPEDLVYVYFPAKKGGCCSKFNHPGGDLLRLKRNYRMYYRKSTVVGQNHTNRLTSVKKHDILVEDESRQIDTVSTLENMVTDEQMQTEESDVEEFKYTRSGRKKLRSAQKEYIFSILGPEWRKQSMSHMQRTYFGKC